MSIQLLWTGLANFCLDGFFQLCSPFEEHLAQAKKVNVA